MDAERSTGCSSVEEFHARRALATYTPSMPSRSPLSPRLASPLSGHCTFLRVWWRPLMQKECVHVATPTFGGQHRVYNLDLRTLTAGLST